MAVTLKLLACKQGFTGPTAGATHDLSPTTAQAKGWLIKNISFFNHTAAALNVELRVKYSGGGGYRMLARGPLVVPANSTAPGVIEREITLDLNGPDVLAAILSTTAAALSADCIICGIERDQ
jgi:hypothetical protein